MNINDSIYKNIEKIVEKQNVFVNEPMKKHTSIRVGGNADIFVKANTIDKVKAIYSLAKKENIKLSVLGNGTNVLVKDNGIRGIVLKIDIDEINIRKEKNKIYIKAGAGVPIIKLSKIAFENSATGLEFAIGIPGTLGGAIKMNAGAYGSEMKNIVRTTTYLDNNGYIKKITNLEQKFEYRSSIFFKIDGIILESELELEVGNKEEIENKMKENLIKRKEKQPLDKPSCGSTFKRGNDFITAKLIDECGLKGVCVGDAIVSTKHAGFVMNNGNATAKDFIELTDQIKNVVYEKFNKNIELEVQIMGE